MNDRPWIASVAAVLLCAIAVVAAILWLADAGIPSETAVPVIVVALLALRSVQRRHKHELR